MDSTTTTTFSAAACVTPTCAKRGALVCPVCKQLGIPPAMSTFCSQSCFKGSWTSHKALHKMLTEALASEQLQQQQQDPKSARGAKRAAAAASGDDRFAGFTFTGKLRPGVVSPMRAVPDHIQKPDYWQNGIPTSEQRAYREGHAIPVYSARKIAGIRAACKAGREVLDIAGQALRVGVSGDDLDRIVHDACIERGCYPSPLNYYSFPKAFCVSVNEIICHGIPDSRAFEDGDIVNLDVSVFKDGFHADLNETFLVGDVDAEGVRLVQTAFECLKAAIAMVRPGTMYRELGKHIAATASKQGFSVVKSFCGHGTGALFHCAPDVPHYAKNKAVGVMKPGHVFTIEPMINAGSWRDTTWPDEWTIATADGARSAQFEHMILVTESGYEILTARENEPVMQWDAAKLQRP